MPNRALETSKTEARRAIFIDFEGEGTQRGSTTPPHPVLLGILVDGRYRYEVLDRRLSLLASTRRADSGMARGTCSEALDETIGNLTEQSVNEGRWIMSFSPHEQAIVHAYCSPPVSAAFSTRFRNAKVLIDRWAKSRPTWREQARDLKTYCDLAGLTPPEPPKGGVAETLRRLARRMDGKRRWGSLPRADRNDGVALLDYNARDCRCLQRLTQRAVNFLAAQNSAEAS